MYRMCVSLCGVLLAQKAKPLIPTLNPGTTVDEINPTHYLKDPKHMGIMVCSRFMGNAGFASSTVPFKQPLTLIPKAPKLRPGKPPTLNTMTDPPDAVWV